MPKWVNAYERPPVKFGSYVVKIDGRYDIIHLPQFSRKMEFSTTLFWLEEDPPKKKNGNKIKSSYFNKYYGTETNKRTNSSGH